MFKGNNHHDEKQSIAKYIIPIALIVIFSCGCSQKIYRVGILCGLDYFFETVESFKIEMSRFGYIEGKNISYEIHKTNFEQEKEKNILKKFVVDRVNLIFALPTEIAVEAKAAAKGTDVPILFAETFIEGNDLVKNINEPGGKITGVRYPGPDLAVKDLEIFIEIIPKIKRVWVPYLKGYPSIPGQLTALHAASARLGVTVIEAPTLNAQNLKAELMKREQSNDIGFDAIMTIYDPVGGMPDTVAVLQEFRSRHKNIFYDDEIFNLVIDINQAGKQAASIADRIFKGTPVGTIPVITPDMVLTIFYKKIQELGLTVPDRILNQANAIVR